MTKGIVRYFHAERGYGIISPLRGGLDAHVYMASVHAAGWQTLGRDQQLNYDLSIDRNGRISAINLRLA